MSLSIDLCKNKTTVSFLQPRISEEIYKGCHVAYNAMYEELDTGYSSKSINLIVVRSDYIDYAQPDSS